MLFAVCGSGLRFCLDPLTTEITDLEEMMKNWFDLVGETWELSNMLHTTANRPLFVTVLVASTDKEVVAIKSGWAGGEPSKPSRGPFFGPWKAIEMVQTINPNDPVLVKTPTPGYSGSGFMGGVRQRINDMWVVTSASGWSQEADALMALVLNFAMVHTLTFHHTGFRHKSRQAMFKAVSQQKRKFGSTPLYRPSSDHDRYYIAEHDYWVEHQYYPNGPHLPAIHWDFATEANLLGFLSQHLDITPELWKDEAGPNDPFGSITLFDRDGMELTVMQRHVWSPVENW